MFDISIPIAFDSANGGFVTVIWHGEDWDYYPTSLVDGFDISDLIKYWLRESFALIIHKTRKRGILPMQISCDVDGRLGCLGGYGVFLNNGKVHIIDERIFRKTCAICPHEWWKCVNSREFKNPKAVRWIVPEKDFLAWVNRLETLMHVRDCMIDTFADHREIRGKNSEILGKVLCDIAGGKDFLSILPFDWMERGRVIVRSGLHGRGKTVELSEYTGMAIEFDKNVAPHRDNDELVWWIKRAFLRDNVVVFLCPHGKTKTGVPVSIVRPSDDIARILPEILEQTKTGSEAVDHVAFSARCELDELKSGGNSVVLARSKFRTLLKGATRVLLGVCKGKAWEEFPLGETKRRARMPLIGMPESKD